MDYSLQAEMGLGCGGYTARWIYTAIIVFGLSIKFICATNQNEIFFLAKNQLFNLSFNEKTLRTCFIHLSNDFRIHNPKKF